MFCGECGTKLEEGMRFCPECGTPVKMPDFSQAAAEKPQELPAPEPELEPEGVPEAEPLSAGAELRVSLPTAGAELLPAGAVSGAAAVSPGRREAESSWIRADRTSGRSCAGACSRAGAGG